MNQPAISVIIPLFNHEAYIKEAVYSVFEQSDSDFEMIIINDGSTDESELIIKKIKDKRLKYFYQKNMGAHRTINRGIKLAQGKYISILNSDDVYDKNRFEQCIKVFENDSSIDAVCTYVDVIDEQGVKFESIGTDYFWKNNEANLSFKDDDNILLNLLAGNFLTTTSNLFCKRSIFDKIGYFSDFRYVHDYDFFLRLCYHCNVHIIQNPLLRYRRHRENTINENQAATDFERGLVLAEFFINHDLTKLFPDIHEITMVKFYNSLSACHSEKIILTSMLFEMMHPSGGNRFKALRQNCENLFRNNCIKHLMTIKQKDDAFWDNYHALIQARHELNLISHSKTYQLGMLFKEARHSLKNFLLLPLRLVWFLLPLEAKVRLKQITNRQ